MIHAKSLGVVALATIGMSLNSGSVQACSCSAIPGQAGAIVAVVGAGSGAIVSSLQLGFQKTASQIEASDAALGRVITQSLTSLGRDLSAQIKSQPAVNESVQQMLDAKSPARHANNECEYLGRAADSAAADLVLGAQQSALSNAVIDYNEIPSMYPEGVNPPVAFAAQTNRLLNENPDIKRATVNLVGSPDKVGAMTPEEVQNTSRALNLAMNPSPPAKLPNPVAPSQIKANVDADLFNLRSSIPQGVAQDILAYEAPLLDLSEDSWYASILERMSEADYADFIDGDKKVSKSDLLRHMATHRMKDPMTTAITAAKEVTGLQKDLALVKADHLVMDYELWRMDRYQALLMSQLVASQVRKER